MLAMNALNQILDIDVGNMQVICQPGVVHAKLNEALAPHKLIFPPDPGSSRMATVGGMASTNAHGMRAVKYGPTSAWVLGLEVVLPDGTIIETGSAGSRAKQSSAGLELTKLIVGRRGHARRGHATAPEADGHPARARHRPGLFDVLEKRRPGGPDGVRLGHQPLGHRDPRRAQHPGDQPLSPGDELAARRSDAAVRGRRQPAGRALGRRDASSRSSRRWRARSNGRTSRRASPRCGKRARWSARRSACCGQARSARTAARTSAVPVSRIPEALRAIQDISARHGLLVATYGHIGGGGLHPGHPDRRPRPGRDQTRPPGRGRHPSPRAAHGRHRHRRARRRRRAGAVHGRRARTGAGRDASTQAGARPEGDHEPGRDLRYARPAVRIPVGRPGWRARSATIDPG